MGAATHFARATPNAKQLRKEAGSWLKELRLRAGLSQIELAARLELKYYTFISQVETGYGRVPTESMEAWAKALGAKPSEFARRLLSFYDPDLYRLLFGDKTMTVIAFTPKFESEANGWTAEERNQFEALYAARAHRGEASECAVEMTETGDPQFFLLGPAPAV